MNWLKKLGASNRVFFLIGAISGVIAIKTQPDGNLLVTSVCALMGGMALLIISLLIKKVRDRFQS